MKTIKVEKCFERTKEGWLDDLCPYCFTDWEWTGLGPVGKCGHPNREPMALPADGTIPVDCPLADAPV